jgi:4-hydroxythreonine-4-phosphate dehydrogenase
MNSTARLLLTMGDVAGIGPEILAKAWADVHPLGTVAVVGEPYWLRKALRLIDAPAEVQVIERLEEARPERSVIPCLRGSPVDLRGVEVGRVSASAGRAAYDFLITAIELTLAGKANGIVTAPLHKEGLRAAGVPHPGHTEVLAAKSGAKQCAMMLYARGPALPHGLGVAHVSLHVALRDVFSLLSTDAIFSTIRLLDGMMQRLLGREPRLGVAALNPHASDGGLFGDEEKRLIAPAVERARAEGVRVSGPWPSDTLFQRAQRGEFDGIVALYHDQGHIPLKLLGGLRAVNITAGLPFVRTSVAHGTAYDIVGRGCASAEGVIEAVRVAALLAGQNSTREAR